MNDFDKPTGAPKPPPPPGGSNSGDGSGHLDFISGERDEAEFKRAREHSQRVRKLKLIMPLVGLLIIAGVGGALLVKQFLYPNLKLDAIALKDGKLVMENPSLAGVDQHQRPFSLSAERAIQDADQPKRVELITINAKLPLEESIFANLVAGNGVYDADKKTLVLSQRVEVVTTDGMRVELEDANIDIGVGTLETRNPIFASSRQADIMSDSLFVQENGKRVVFEGKVRMTLRPKEMREIQNRSE